MIIRLNKINFNPDLCIRCQNPNIRHKWAELLTWNIEDWATVINHADFQKFYNLPFAKTIHDLSICKDCWKVLITKKEITYKNGYYNIWPYFTKKLQEYI